MLSFLSCLNSSNNKSDNIDLGYNSNALKEKELLGNVKFCSISIFDVAYKFGEPVFTGPSDKDAYDFDINGNITKEFEYFQSGYIFLTASYIYNSNNLVVECDRYYFNITEMSIYFAHKEKLKYNSDNLLIENISYDSNGDLSLIYSYNYDNLGRLILEQHYSDKESQPHYVKSINYEGNCVTEHVIMYDIYFNKIDDKTYGTSLDSCGNILSRFYYRDNVKIVTSECSYASDCLKSSEKTFDSKGNYLYSSYYVYDSNGIKTAIKYVNDDGSIEHQIYEYTYDKVGNWITCKVIFQDEIANYYEREITYY